MVFGLFAVTGVIKLPIRIRRRGRVRGRGVKWRIVGPLRTRILLWRNGIGRFVEKVGCGADWTVELVVPHDVTERKKYARKQQHQHEQADDVPAFEHPLSGAPSFSTRSHSYFIGPPKFLVH